MGGFELSKKIDFFSFLSLISLLLLTVSCKNADDNFESVFTFLGDSSSPRIISAVPGMGDSSLPREQKITVLFDKPMNINSCVQSFSLVPPVQGFYELSDFSMTFIPSNLFSYGSYTYNIIKNCEDKDGNDLRDVFSATFTIGEPAIAGTFPAITSINVASGTEAECNSGSASSSNFLTESIENACMGNPNVNRIRIIFDRPMDKVSTIGAVSISPNFNYTNSWESETSLVLIPDTPFPDRVRVNVNVSTLAQDAQGIRMQLPIAASYRVGTANLVPRITSIFVSQGNLTDCAGGLGAPIDITSNDITNGCLGNPNSNNIAINFSREMNTSVTQSSLQVVPPISGNRVWSNNNQTLTIQPDSKLNFGTRYSITVTTQALSAENIPFSNLASHNFVAGGLLDEAPFVQAIGVSSQGCANSFPGTGSPSGGDWTMGSCFWDNSLPVLSPSAYHFRAGDQGTGSSGGPPYSPLSCLDVNTDNFKIIFSNYMDLNSTVNAVRLNRISPPVTIIQLATWNWTDCQAVAPYGCRVLTVVYAEQESSCNGLLFGNANHGGDFNLMQSDNMPNGIPFYTLRVDTSARDVNNISLPSNFIFTMEAK